MTAASGEHPNTATSHGTYGGTTYDSFDSTATYKTAALTIVKTVACNDIDSETCTYYGAGDAADYKYVITNSGFAILAGPIKISDDKIASVTCPALSTIGNGDNYFNKDESITCTFSYSITDADVTAGSVTNTASAFVDPYGASPAVTSNPDYVTITYSPTLVFISDFRAYNDNGQVVVEWETSSERNTLGFNLLRLDPVTKEYLQINSGLLPSMLKPHRGGIYSIRDSGASPGGFYIYKLVEVETGGGQISYGPFTVKGRRITLREELWSLGIFRIQPKGEG